MSDKEIRWSDAMRAERRGDAAAYARLLDEVAQSARRIVASRLRGPQDEVEDVVQDVLIGIHKMRDRWQEDRPILPWIHAILRYKINDALRRRYRETLRRRELSYAEWEAIVDDSAGDPWQAAVDVEHHLRHLPPGQQAVVRSLALEGKSVRQLAGDMNQSEGAVRVTLHRALKRLRALGGDG
ncbi:sigma-70 family RNA polymerase sigma factor, partial [Thioclava sp. BHET1]